MLVSIYAMITLTFVAELSLVSAATLTPTVDTVSVYAMDSASTGVTAITAVSGLVGDNC